MNDIPMPDIPALTPAASPDGKPSLVDQCIDRLVAWHVTCPDHSALPSQEVLAKATGVSRTVLREALQTLQTRGMLEVRPRVGSRLVPEQRWCIVDGNVVAWRIARKNDPAFAADLATVLHLVLPEAARDASIHASQAEIALLLAHCDRCLSARCPDTYREARHGLSRALLRTSRNQIVRQMDCFAIVDGHTDVTARSDAHHESIRTALTRLHDALAARESVAVRQAVEQLIACESAS